jgi:hypothetical protein
MAAIVENINGFAAKNARLFIPIPVDSMNVRIAKTVFRNLNMSQGQSSVLNIRRHAARCAIKLALSPWLPGWDLLLEL